MRSTWITAAFLITIMMVAFLSAPVSAQVTGSAFEQGLALFYQKQFKECKDYFFEAFKQNPQDVLAISFYLHASFKAGQLIEAVNKLEQHSIDLGDSDIGRAQVGVGYVSRGLLDSNMLNEALTTFREILDKNPELPAANTGMGMVYFHKRLMPRAKGFFVKAVKNNPSDIMALELLGDILMVDEKNPQAALELYNRITQIAPTYSDGFFNAASAYEKLGNKEEALKLYRRCMDIDSKGVLKGYFAPIRIGDIYLENKEYEKAEEYYKAALAINPDNPLAKTLLKRAQAKGKEWEGTTVNPLKDKLDKKLDQ